VQLSGFILNTYPAPYRLVNGKEHCFVVPIEELALLDGATWTVTNGHSENGDTKTQGEGQIIGKTSPGRLKGNFLHVNNVDISITPESGFAGSEFSTVYECEKESITPYSWIDQEGRIGQPGTEYTVDQIHRDLLPINVALVKNGRYGKNVSARESRSVVYNSAMSKKKELETPVPADTEVEQEVVINDEGVSPGEAVLTADSIAECIKAALAPLMERMDTLEMQFNKMCESNSEETPAKEVAETPKTEVLTLDAVKEAIANSISETLKAASLATPKERSLNSATTDPYIQLAKRWEQQ
jgi:hypothetical protein